MVVRVEKSLGARIAVCFELSRLHDRTTGIYFGREKPERANAPNIAAA